jgi:hypothetical protein
VPAVNLPNKKASNSMRAVRSPVSFYLYITSLQHGTTVL